jgi:hypothetical protein
MVSAKHRALGACLLVFFYALAAAASFNGFYAKHGLREAFSKSSIVSMLEGTADRPYVYRQLVPAIANSIDAHVPGSIRAALDRRLTAPALANPAQTSIGLWAGVANNPAYSVRYFSVYLISFALYFAAFFCIRSFCRTAGASPLGATLAPPMFGLFLNYLLNIGGVFYDFTETFMFFTALVIAASKSWRWMLIPFAAVATMNKESFVFFLFACSPILIAGRRDYRGAAIFLAAELAASAVYLLEKYQFRNNPGESVEIHFFANLKFYSNPLNLLDIAFTYGVPMPSSYSIATVFVLIALFNFGWTALQLRYRRFFYLALTINTPLVLAFCFQGEMRDFSLLFPSVALLMAHTVDALFAASKENASPYQNPVMMSGAPEP